MVTSPTRTLTVPAGSSGVLKFALLNTGFTDTYSKNGGTFTSYANNATVTFANNDTLAFKEANMISGDDQIITITDNVTGAAVGTCELTRP